MGDDYYNESAMLFSTSTQEDLVMFVWKRCVSIVTFMQDGVIGHIATGVREYLV